MLGCGTEVTKGSAAEGSTGLRIVALIHLGIAEFEENPCTCNLPALFVFEGTCGVGYGLRPVSELIVGFGKAVQGFSMVVIVAQRAVKQLNCTAEVAFLDLGSTGKSEVIAGRITGSLSYICAALRCGKLNGTVEVGKSTFQVISSALNKTKLMVRLCIVCIALEGFAVDFLSAVVVVRVKLGVTPLKQNYRDICRYLLCNAGVTHFIGKGVGFVKICNGLLKVTGTEACLTNLNLNCGNLCFGTLTNVVGIAASLPCDSTGLLELIKGLLKLTCPKQFLCLVEGIYCSGAVLCLTHAGSREHKEGNN